MLEWNDNGWDTPDNQRYLALGFERGDTLCFLQGLAKRLSAGNIEIRYADRREINKFSTFTGFNAKIMLIILALVRTRDFVTIEEELWNMFLRNNLYEFQAVPGISEWTEVKSKLCHDASFFSEIFPRLTQIYRSLQTRASDPPYPAEEFLNYLTKIISDLEDYRRGYYAPDTPQYSLLGAYIEKINRARERLVGFFNTYLPDKTQPWQTAIFNSMERTQSFQPYVDLMDSNIEGETLVDIIRGDIADAGFYMDITDAIRSGAQRVVLYAGEYHILTLKTKLLLTYSKLTAPIIPENIGFQYPEGGLRVEDLRRDTRIIPIPPPELRRALGLP